MAIKKIQKNRLNENNEFDVIHYETEAELVLTSDGSNVEDKLNAVADKTCVQIVTWGSED